MHVREESISLCPLPGRPSFHLHLRRTCTETIELVALTAGIVPKKMKRFNMKYSVSYGVSYGVRSECELFIILL